MYDKIDACCLNVEWILDIKIIFLEELSDLRLSFFVLRLLKDVLYSYNMMAEDSCSITEVNSESGLPTRVTLFDFETPKKFNIRID